MKGNVKTKNLIALCLNAAVVCFVLYTTISGIIEEGLFLFRYYTELSNLFGGIMACIYLYYLIRRTRDINYKIPSIITELKFFAVCCLLQTFLIVVLVLAPQRGGWQGYQELMFGKTTICTHLLTPLTLSLSFLFFETEPLTKNIFRALIPTGIYAIITIILNISKVLYGPYFFLHVYEQTIWMTFVWCIVVLGVNALIVWGCGSLKKYLLK